MCCKLTEVPELNKQVHTWCQHCEKGVGCNIYEQRPASCQAYRCVWLSGGLPADLRPDKSKVIFERLPSGKNYLVVVDLNRPDAWKKPVVQDVINAFLQAGRSIVISGNPNKMLLAKGKNPNTVLEDINAALKNQYGAKQ